MKIRLICIALLLSIIIVITVNSTPREWKKEYYVVAYGDTLWDICEPYCPDDMEVWEYIALVKEASGLDSSTIYQGQIIVLLR